MVIGPVVSEILGGWYHPPDAIALSKRADAIKRIKRIDTTEKVKKMSMESRGKL